MMLQIFHKKKEVSMLKYEMKYCRVDKSLVLFEIRYSHNSMKFEFQSLYFFKRGYEKLLIWKLLSFLILRYKALVYVAFLLVIFNILENFHCMINREVFNDMLMQNLTLENVTYIKKNFLRQGVCNDILC